MSVAVVFQQMLMIFILGFMGYLLTRLGMFSEFAGRDLSMLVVNVCNPALMLMNVMDEGADVPPENLIIMAVVSLIVYAILVVLGLLIPRFIRVPGKDRNFYNLMSLFGNTGFIGIPVVSAVLGPSGVVYVVIFNIYFALLVYTYGKFLICRCVGSNAVKFRIRDLVNVGTISSVISIVIYLCHIHPPMVISESITYMGRTTTFICMVVIGINLAQMPLRKTFGNIHDYGFVLIRQFLVPILLGLVLKHFIQDEIVYGATLLMLAVPAGNLPLMMAKEAGADGEVLARGIVVTTVLSVVTIPLVVFFAV